MDFDEDDFPNMPLTKNKKPKKPNPDAPEKKKRKPGRPKKEKASKIPAPPTSPIREKESFFTPTIGWDVDDEREEAPVTTRDTHTLTDEIREHEALEEEMHALLDEYYGILDDNPHLKFVEGLELKEFTPDSDPAEIEHHIKKLKKALRGPLANLLYERLWSLFTLGLEKTLAKVPMGIGENFDTRPSPHNPEPVSLHAALNKKEVLDEAIPVIDDLVDEIPWLEHLSKLGDPRMKLALTVGVAIGTVYDLNMKKRKEIQSSK